MFSFAVLLCILGLFQINLLIPAATPFSAFESVSYFALLLHSSVPLAIAKEYLQYFSISQSFPASPNAIHSSAVMPSTVHIPLIAVPLFTPFAVNSILTGIDEARRFIMENVLRDVEIGETHRFADYKTELQEVVQRRADQHIAYELVGESGPDHSKVFTFRVTINGVPRGEGSGRTKKEAEQAAACKALEALRQ